MAYSITPAGKRTEITERLTNEQACEIIGCSWVECVFPRKSPNIMFLCDETGHLKPLPLNPHGEELYGAPIAGTIIVMTRAEARAWDWL